LDDTWFWDGVDWRRYDGPRPPRRRSHALVYDAARDSVVLFSDDYGLSNATWELTGTRPGTYHTWGVGCPGTAGVPTLAAAPGQRPVVGQSFRLSLVNLPPGAPVLLTVGFSTEVAGPLPLPLELGPLGMPSCWLWASLDVAYGLANANGTASLVLPIPNDPRHAGLVFYDQGFVFDPGANPAGVIVTNAGEGHVGLR
jgi:hypothetical protein